MKRNVICYSLIAAAAFTFICSYVQQEVIAALAAALAAHELGHMAVMRSLGLRIRHFAFEPNGCCIEYSGCVSRKDSILSAAAGPATGLIYSLTAGIAAESFNIHWLELSSDISLLLSAFNLLPILPLDGGQIFSELCCLLSGEENGTRLARKVSIVSALVVLTAGLILAIRGVGTALFAAAVWLLIFQRDGMGDCKTE